MKDLLVWCKEAVSTFARALLTLLVLVLAFIGLHSVYTMAVEINAEQCVAITDHVSACLVDDRKMLRHESSLSL